MQAATSESSLLYERLANDLLALITRGALKPGDRLPSVRRLSRQERVSVATVLATYRLLEERGVIEARAQSGHYVQRSQRASLPAPRSARALTRPTRVTIADRVATVYGGGRDRTLVPLGAAQLGSGLLPAARMARLLASVARSAGEAGIMYDYPPGSLSLRRQIARRSLAWGAPLSPDELITTIGTMEALHLALRAVTRPGDTVAVESPCDYGLLQLIESLGLCVVEIPVDAREGLSLEALDEALRALRVRACVTMPNFNNPLGCVMSDARKQALVDMLARREIPLIEDDIYGDLCFGITRPKPLKAFDREGLVLTCASFTKALAPGYRVGFIAPGRYYNQVERLKFAQSVATPTLPQLAVAAFLESGGYERHLRLLRARLRSQVERMSEAVTATFPPGTRVSRPEGGFVLWIELPGGASGMDLHLRALERGIMTVPGALFSAHQRFSNCLRLSCGNPWSPAIERAVGMLGTMAAELCEKR